MYIKALQLRNFRNFVASTLQFHEGVNTLIGENASGKTNVFHALRLLLDDGLPRNALRLRERDFSRSLGSWKGHWIVVRCIFGNLSPDDSSKCLATHIAGHMDANETGAYSLVFRPKLGIRKQLHTLSASDGDRPDLPAFIHQLTVDDYEASLLCRGTWDPTDDAQYLEFAGDFANLTFPDPEQEDAAGIGTPVHLQMKLTSEVCCTYVKALRDVVRDMRNPNGNPLATLLRKVSKLVSKDALTGIGDAISSLNTSIEGLDQVAQVREELRKRLQRTVGKTYAPDLSIKSELSSELDLLMESLTLWASDELGSTQGRMNELSLGGANLIYIGLRLLEYESNLSLSRDHIANFLLIEEPEAHIHTHLQKTLFQRVQESEAQIFVSTHSTHLSSASKISSINVLCRKAGQSQVFHPCAGLSEIECSRIERYLDTVRSTVLFAKGLVLVEGDAELILLPAIFQAVFGLSLDEVGVSLVSMDGTVFTHVASLFHDDRIQRRCAIITDTDDSIYSHLTFDDRNELHVKARNSQTKGAERKTFLDEFCKGNPWVNAFYATHTFEVDFLGAGNISSLETVLDSHYKVEPPKTKSLTKLRDPDVAVSGEEILRLAKVIGKGWLALLVAEQVTWSTKVPNYILKALSFAAGEQLSARVIHQIIDHRLHSFAGAGDPRAASYRNQVAALNEGSAIGDFMGAYTQEFGTTDPLSELYAGK